MNTLVHHPLYTVGLIYIVVLIARAVMSWFPVEPRSVAGSVNHWLWVLTEPYLRPFRRLVPPMGMLDVSYMLAVLVAWLVTDLLLARFSW